MSRETTQGAPKRTFNVDLSVDATGIGENLRVKLGSSAFGNDVTVCGAGERGIGTTDSDCFPPVNGDTTGVRQITVVLDGFTKIMEASGVVTRGDVVGPAASGQVASQTIDTSAPGTTVPSIGISFETSTQAGDEIEIMQLGGYVPV